MDESKILLLYAHAHRAAILNPGDEITINFFDDQLNILNGLHQFFNADKNLLPRQVSLYLRQYSNGKLDENGSCYTEIKGEGEVDNKYDWTTRYMSYLASKMVRVNSATNPADQLRALRQYSERGYSLYPKAKDDFQEIKATVNVGVVFSGNDPLVTHADFLRIRQNLLSSNQFRSQLDTVDYRRMFLCFEKWENWVNSVVSVVKNNATSTAGAAAAVQQTEINVTAVSSNAQLRLIPSEQQIQQQQSQQDQSCWKSIYVFFSCCCCCDDDVEQATNQSEISQPS